MRFYTLHDSNPSLPTTNLADLSYFVFVNIELAVF